MRTHPAVRKIREFPRTLFLSCLGLYVKKIGALNQKERSYASPVANSWLRHCRRWQSMMLLMTQSQHFDCNGFRLQLQNPQENCTVFRRTAYWKSPGEQSKPIIHSRLIFRHDKIKSPAHS